MHDPGKDYCSVQNDLQIPCGEWRGLHNHYLLGVTLLDPMYRVQEDLVVKYQLWGSEHCVLEMVGCTLVIACVRKIGRREKEEPLSI